MHKLLGPSYKLLKYRGPGGHCRSIFSGLDTQPRMITLATVEKRVDEQARIVYNEMLKVFCERQGTEKTQSLTEW